MRLTQCLAFRYREMQMGQGGCVANTGGRLAIQRPRRRLRGVVRVLTAIL